MFGRLIREPLLHFAGLALIIFVLYFAVTPFTAEPVGNSIVVTRAKIEQMADVFTLTWQRPPNADELKELIDGYVKEEMYVREALLLGLDKDDAVIRRRLQTKMEFLTDMAVDALEPSDAELQAYLTTHAEEFAESPLTGFQQIFLNPERHGDQIRQDAQTILAFLLADPSADPLTLGDATMLPFELPLSSTMEIGQTFGADFADAVSQAPSGVWTGPIASGFGLHIIRVVARKPGHLPALADVRDDVLREWSNEQRNERSRARVDEMLKQYEVTIESAPALSANE